jgi:hypothetical protein
MLQKWVCSPSRMANTANYNYGEIGKDHRCSHPSPCCRPRHANSTEKALHVLRSICFRKFTLRFQFGVMSSHHPLSLFRLLRIRDTAAVLGSLGRDGPSTRNGNRCKCPQTPTPTSPCCFASDGTATISPQKEPHLIGLFCVSEKEDKGMHTLTFLYRCRSSY